MLERDDSLRLGIGFIWPAGDNALLKPRIDVSLKTGIASRKILGSVIKTGHSIDAMSRHSAADAATFFVDGDWKSMIRQGSSSEQPGDSRADHGNGWDWFETRRCDPGPIRDCVQTQCMIGSGTRADAAENPGFWLERPIELTQTPKQAAVGCRISTVQRKTMIQINHPFQRLLRRLRPIKDRFAPGHAHVVMQFALPEQGQLSRIPKGIVRLAPGQFFPAVKMLVKVVCVSFQCRLRQSGSAVH